ncbi:MAG: Glycerol-3-phosphate dehydrogenase (NAD(P)+) [Syntrophorhabdus sp. PtaB.Bin047]|jgi:glycerol-3-phosphate dehydrogenase (NAD(P)+)|nr:MAG: Glycerol-3-phosphate dehydrogenase (NAD(P)+) [Syntrophorhabdus sp. PtaB.Bin047]
MKVAVIGAGAWGTAFAIHLARTGKSVLLWAYEKDLVTELRERRENTAFLPGFKLDSATGYTNNLQEAVEFADTVVIATPSFALRDTLTPVGARLRDKKILILTKGIERSTLKLMNEVVEEMTGSTGDTIATLSGPSFALEVARGLFTAAVVASRNMDLSFNLQERIHSDYFRVYRVDDITGVELGGALKNVMAIGSGIIEGLNFGTNTQAAFTTRALAEIKRLGLAMGARETTFMGLSGMGDLILTSYGSLSRNRVFGIELAKGRSSADIIASQKTVVEGYYTINAAYNLAARLGVSMPITEELYHIVYEGKDITASLKDIITREFKKEDY